MGFAALIKKKAHGFSVHLFGREIVEASVSWVDAKTLWQMSDRILTFLLAVFIFLNTIPHTTSIKEFCFYPSLCVFVILIVRRNISLVWRSPLVMPLALLTIWSFLSIFFALNPLESLSDFFSHWLKYIGLYLLLTHLFADFKGLSLLAWLAAASGALYSIAAMVIWYFIMDHPLDSRMGDFKSMGLTIAGFLMLQTLFFALHLVGQERSKVKKWALGTMVLIVLTGAALSQSRGTLLALGLSLTVFYIHRIWRILIIWGTILSLTLVLPALKAKLYHGGLQLEIRSGLFYYSLEIIKDYPIIGTGFAIDTFRDPQQIDPDKYLARIPEQYRHPVHPYWWPHNMFLSVGVRLGLVGVVLMAYLWIMALQWAWRLARQGTDFKIREWGRCIGALLVMFFTKAMFDPFETHMVETMLFTFLSMLTVAWRQNQSLSGLSTQ